MNTLSLWILNILVSISPPQNQIGESEIEARNRYESIADDMAYAIEFADPIFKGKDAKFKEAALLTSIAFYESSGFKKDIDSGKIRGDNGKSWCLMQINVGTDTIKFGNSDMKSWKGQDLVKDRKKCFLAGIESIKISRNLCSKLSESGSLSVYTTGRCIPNQKEALYRWNFSNYLFNKFNSTSFSFVKNDGTN